jgi:hypothetical protein
MAQKRDYIKKRFQGLSSEQIIETQTASQSVDKTDELAAKLIQQLEIVQKTLSSLTAHVGSVDSTTSAKTQMANLQRSFSEFQKQHALIEKNREEAGKECDKQIEHRRKLVERLQELFTYIKSTAKTFQFEEPTQLHYRKPSGIKEIRTSFQKQKSAGLKPAINWEELLKNET